MVLLDDVFFKNYWITEICYSTCCSGEIVFEDLSKVKNPTEPKKTVTPKFLKEFESYLEIGYVNGISELFLHDYTFDFNSAIVIGYEMYQEILDVGSGKTAEELNDDLYEHFGKITYKISDYLRKNGYETYVAHPREEKINFSALAKKANMGNIGIKNHISNWFSNVGIFWMDSKK